MQTRQLGNTDLHITSIGLGTWAIGGAGWAASWGEQDDNDSITAMINLPARLQLPGRFTIQP